MWKYSKLYKYEVKTCTVSLSLPSVLPLLFSIIHYKEKTHFRTASAFLMAISCWSVRKFESCLHADCVFLESWKVVGINIYQSTRNKEDCSVPFIYLCS